MKSKWFFACLVALTGTALYVGNVFATSSTGFTSTTLAKAQFGELDSHVHTVPADWQTWIKTKGVSDLYVQSNVFAPGGSSGWHTHPGPSLITVTAGTVTVYEGDDPSCSPKVYSVNGTNGFVDVGGGDVHMIRNEGAEEARTVVVQLIPAGAARRIDAPAPGNCPF
jgi:predicted metal-dependent enzyme (double-stranded beta helix superfamily)